MNIKSVVVFICVLVLLMAAGDNIGRLIRVFQTPPVDTPPECRQPNEEPKDG